jgi:hypothetical protein
MRPTLDQLMSEIERDWERAQRQARESSDAANVWKGIKQCLWIAVPVLVVVISIVGYFTDSFQ